MHKDLSPVSNHLSYSAVTDHNKSTSNTQPYEIYQKRYTTLKLANNNHRNSLKVQSNNDLAFLRNTIGPISSLNTQNNVLKVNQSKKADVSLRQTMNVTRDLRQRLKFSQNPDTKIINRSQTENEYKQQSNIHKKNNKNDDLLQKIMEKYQKKNETKQALKLLQQLKQLKKKQQQLKKQRKNETLKQQQAVNKLMSINYQSNSPKNFSKKNKIDFYTPVHNKKQLPTEYKKQLLIDYKKQLSTNAISPHSQSILNPRSKKNSPDITRQQIIININTNSYKQSTVIQKQQPSYHYDNIKISQSPAHNNSANLKHYQTSQQNYKGANYSFSKGTKYQQKDLNYNNLISKKYSTNDLTVQPFQKNNKNTYTSNDKNSSFTQSFNQNTLTTTSKDNSYSSNYSKSPNSKSYLSKTTNPDYLSTSVSNNSKKYTTSDKNATNNDSYSSSYSKKQYQTPNSKSLYNTARFNTSPKDVFLNRKVTINDFVLGKNLGQGKFGTVFQAFDKKTKSLYALKKVPKSIIKSHWMVDQFILQVKIQNYLNHPNILSFHGCFDDLQNVYILLEYMEQGTLFLHLKKNSTLCQKQAAIKLKQIASAIQYLHQNGIAHRDLKPQNIVMSHGVCKLCDFGWATICDERRKTYCGTFDYAAPQILQGSQYDMSVDLWCLGILAYQILVGKAPFYHISRKQTMKKIMNCQNQKIHYPSSMSYEAKSFIEQLLRKNPQQRLKSQDLLKHPFFRLADQ